jgi:RNA polymerase sigma factor (sigma-70 family)
MYDDPAVVALVEAARGGDRTAWEQIVDRYAPLVWSICLRHRLSRADTDDVGQSVWLSLFVNLRSLREPAALPGWLARTTRNECLRVLREAGQRERVEHTLVPESGVEVGYEVVEEELERTQRQVALRESFDQLRPQCQRLLSLLFRDARPPYLQIGSQLDMKVGSIGPTRERCLAELRRCPAMAALIEAQRREGTGGEVRAQ